MAKQAYMGYTDGHLYDFSRDGKIKVYGDLVEGFTQFAEQSSPFKHAGFNDLPCAMIAAQYLFSKEYAARHDPSLGNTLKSANYGLIILDEYLDGRYIKFSYSGRIVGYLELLNLARGGELSKLHFGHAIFGIYGIKQDKAFKTKVYNFYKKLNSGIMGAAGQADFPKFSLMDRVPQVDGSVYYKNAVNDLNILAKIAAYAWIEAYLGLLDKAGETWHKDMNGGMAILDRNMDHGVFKCTRDILRERILE